MKILFTLFALLGCLIADAQNIYLKVKEPIFSDRDATNNSDNPSLNLSDYIELSEATVSFHRQAGNSGRNQQGLLTVKILERDGLFSLPYLIESKLLGNTHDDGEIIFTKGGDEGIYQKYEFAEFLITGTEKEFSDESELVIDIFFKYFKQTNYSINSNGSQNEPRSFSWNFERDQPW